jgi:hypothetical protein
MQDDHVSRLRLEEAYSKGFRGGLSVAFATGLVGAFVIYVGYLWGVSSATNALTPKPQVTVLAYPATPKPAATTIAPSTSLTPGPKDEN